MALLIFGTLETKLQPRMVSEIQPLAPNKYFDNEQQHRMDFYLF